MTTPFSDVFDQFLSKITDSQLLSIPQVDLEGIMTNYLKSSITRFRKCKQNLNDYDLVLQQFNITLTIDEIEILSNWMTYEYLNQNVLRIELLKQSLSSKDYAQYSQANHLDKLILLRHDIYMTTNQMITDYGYDFGQIGLLQ